MKRVTPLPRAGFGPEASVGLWTLMHRSTGTDTPLLLFLPSVPSGAAAETGPTKVVRERSCKIEGWRGKERRRDGRRLLEAERGKREKKRSLVLVPSPPPPPSPLPSPPRGEKNLPSSHCGPGRTQPRCPSNALAVPQRRAPSQTRRHGPCRRLPWSSTTPGVSNPARGTPALAHQLLLPGILILSPASSIPVRPAACVILSRGLAAGEGVTTTFQPP